ncbi:MAG: transcription-repair coupling factor [Acidaminobacteraceae bacterium]
MRKSLINIFENSTEYTELKKSLKSGQTPIYLYGIWESVVAHVAACLSTDFGMSVLVVNNEIEAKKIIEDLRTFVDDVYHFPHREITFFDSFAHSKEIENQRIDVINKLINCEKGLYIMTIESMQQVMAPKKMFSTSMNISLEGILDVNTLPSYLVKLGYERVDLVEGKGQFSIRGGIVDIFVPSLESAVRIELFGDEIDSIREFDITNQLSTKKIETFDIKSSNEFVISDDNVSTLIKKLKSIVSRRKLDEKKVDSLNRVVYKLENDEYIDGLDKFLPLLFEELNSIVDYIPDEVPLILLNPMALEDKAEIVLKDYLERFTSYFEKKSVIREQAELLFKYDVVKKKLEKKNLVLVDNIKKQVGDFRLSEIIHIKAIEAPVYHSKLENLKKDIENWKYKGYKILIVIDGEEKCRRLSEQFSKLDIASTIDTKFEGEIKSSMCVIGSGSLRQGYVFATFKTIILTEKEIFGIDIKKRSKRRKNKDKIIKSFNELSISSLVVHENHGIGKYIGIEQLSVDGMKKDFLKIKYSGEDYLYIPVEQMDSLQKYIGSDEDKTKLSKMGSIEWRKAKAKVVKSIEDMTDELLELYSQRTHQKGYAYGPDTDWQKQFENMFPYEETGDQLKCIAEIKEDMEKDSVMERLLCGDVGYGKTEVAIRAIFKAVMDSKQVAFLVPTTILAQQHYTNISDRFSKFPVSVDMLSRFRTKKQQDGIIENVRTGVVDVIIGTHRILSKDMDFKDLGLLIIDEEQRFGVKDKEAIKTLKKSVDVLSLTATPIPRTLHMSLIGIRDMSVIEDPPEDRYPIQTYVIESDDNLIAEALDREVSRGGQAFFVHNRVKDIDRVTAKLKDMLPDIDIRYAHGQMSEIKLEKLMIQFTNHEFDVLVCTTIIETGLDISNANTIIINNADKMGLSQLYQLRGRVGRSNKIAYAYLLYQKDKMLSEVAEKRLKAIKEFTELGSGFKIAMKDLEIRGAGNLLGSQQHGHMASIGYELYCNLLEESIRKAKGEFVEESMETLIEFNINAFIPDTLVKVQEHKLDLYKKISSIRDRDDAYRIEEEIEDRYGTLPQSVYNLLEVSYAKALGQKIRIKSIGEIDDTAIFRLNDDAPITPDTLAKCEEMFGSRIKFNIRSKPNVRYRYRKSKASNEDRLKEIIGVLEKINGILIN